MAEENQPESPNYNPPGWQVETVQQTVIVNLPPEGTVTALPNAPPAHRCCGGSVRLWSFCFSRPSLPPRTAALAGSRLVWSSGSPARTALHCGGPSRAGPGQAAGEVTRFLSSSLQRAAESSSFRVVAVPAVADRTAALTLARRYAAPLIVWGKVFEFNDLNARVHLAVVDRLGIAQGGEWEPFRLQHFPVASASLTADIPCEGEADCLGTESGSLAQSAPAVARLALGLADYSLRRVARASAALQPLALCALDEADSDCAESALLPYLNDRARSLLLYYAGRTVDMQQDYAEALAYLAASSALAADNPAR